MIHYNFESRFLKELFCLVFTNQNSCGQSIRRGQEFNRFLNFPLDRNMTRFHLFNKVRRLSKMDHCVKFDQTASNQKNLKRQGKKILLQNLQHLELNQ